jgi:hypothetical protein
MAEPNDGYSVASGRRYPPRRWGESDREKEALIGVFLFIVRGEREGVVPVLHVDGSRPTVCRSVENVAQCRSPVSAYSCVARSVRS